MVKVDTSESKAEGGSGGVEGGEYHWMIDDVSVEAFRDDDTQQDRQSIKVVMSVLAGTTAGQVGHKHTEFFPLTGKAVDRLRRLLVATGLMTDEQWVKMIPTGIDFDETFLKGRQFCGRIKMEKYQGRKSEYKDRLFPKMGFDMWSVFDSKAAHIPKDRTILAMIPGGAQVAAQTSQSQQASNVQQPASQTAAAPQSAFKW